MAADGGQWTETARSESCGQRQPAASRLVASCRWARRAAASPGGSPEQQGRVPNSGTWVETCDRHIVWIRTEPLLLRKEREKDRERGREKETETRVSTPRERTVSELQDGEERSEVARSGCGLSLKGTRDQKNNTQQLKISYVIKCQQSQKLCVYICFLTFPWTLWLIVALKNVCFEQWNHSPDMRILQDGEIRGWWV